MEDPLPWESGFLGTRIIAVSKLKVGSRGVVLQLNITPWTVSKTGIWWQSAGRRTNSTGP